MSDEGARASGNARSALEPCGLGKLSPQPVPFVGLELHGEPADVTRRVRRSSRSPRTAEKRVKSGVRLPRSAKIDVVGSDPSSLTPADTGDAANMDATAPKRHGCRGTRRPRPPDRDGLRHRVARSATTPRARLMHPQKVKPGDTGLKLHAHGSLCMARGRAPRGELGLASSPLLSERGRLAS